MLFLYPYCHTFYKSPLFRTCLYKNGTDHVYDVHIDTLKENNKCECCFDPTEVLVGLCANVNEDFLA